MSHEAHEDGLATKHTEVSKGEHKESQGNTFEILVFFVARSSL
jgi:hypothetical protein